MAIFVLTTTTTRPITLPLAHVRGVMRDKGEIINKSVLGIVVLKPYKSKDTDNS